MLTAIDITIQDVGWLDKLASWTYNTNSIFTLTQMKDLSEKERTGAG